MRDLDSQICFTECSRHGNAERQQVVAQHLQDLEPPLIYERRAIAGRPLDEEKNARGPHVNSFLWRMNG
jgi:hypothetical protein